MDDADALVTEHATGRERDDAVNGVDVGGTDERGRGAHDGVVRTGVGNRLVDHADLAVAEECERFHPTTSSRLARGFRPRAQSLERSARSRLMVASDKEAALRARMADLGVREEDLDESFICSSGPGGQNVNKTSTCVVLLHRPSGVRVRCQETRSQAMNRFLARRRLADEIERRARGAVAAEQERAEKIRRQKRRRSRRAKAKMLDDKARNSDKKALRGRVRPE